MLKTALRSQSGFMVVATVMVIIFVIPVFIMMSSRFSTSLVEARTGSTQKMMITESVANIAVIIRSAYIRAKAVGCSDGILISTPEMNGNGQVSLCLPDDRSVINRVAPDNPFRINSSNAQLMASAPERLDLRDMFDNFVQYLPALQFSLFEKAQANVQQTSSQPPLLTYIPLSRPTTAPPARSCDGVDLICLTVRLCQLKTTCTEENAFYQRFGFRP